jgi:hypothetical protein
MIVRRVLRDDRARAISTRCPECNRELHGNGELYFDEGLAAGWTIGFYCPYDREVFPIWTPEFEPFLEEATRNVDTAALPLFDWKA